MFILIPPLWPAIPLILAADAVALFTIVSPFSPTTTLMFAALVAITF